MKTDFTKVAPVFDCDSAIVFSANEYFCPYMTVMIQSVIDHASEQNNYDILILNRDITKETQNIIASLAAGQENISIRFVDVRPYVSEYDFFIGGKDDFTAEAYFRLLIPYVLDDSYHKALYLDGDMLAVTDIYPLVQVDIEHYLLASTRDYNGLAVYYDHDEKKRRKYRDDILKLSAPDDYFISGMLLLNLNLFREKYSMQSLLKFATSRDWLQHDQDVLNVLCDGGLALLLDEAWDVMMPYKPELLPDYIRKKMEDAFQNPKIIHYGGFEKPWKNNLHYRTRDFWETAIRTPFYYRIIDRTLERCSQYGPENIKDTALDSFSEGKIGFKYILQYIMAWIQYKCRR